MPWYIGTIAGHSQLSGKTYFWDVTGTNAFSTSDCETFIEAKRTELVNLDLPFWLRTESDKFKQQSYRGITFSLQNFAAIINSVVCRRFNWDLEARRRGGQMEQSKLNWQTNVCMVVKHAAFGANIFFENANFAAKMSHKNLPLHLRKLRSLCRSCWLSFDVFCHLKC